MSKVPVLYDELNLTERTYLANMIMHPGYPVLLKLANAVCSRANADVIKIDPAMEGYDRRLSVLQQRARTMSEFSDSLFESADFHKRAGEAQIQEQNVEKSVNEALAEKESR